MSKINDKNIQTEIRTADDLKKLEGIYANCFNASVGKIIHIPGNGQSDTERCTILNQLFRKLPETTWRDSNNKRIDSKEQWVKIALRSKKRLTLSLYHNDRFIFSKIVHGKFKNGYFYVRPKVFIYPFVPLVFGYNFERARMSISGNDLILDYSVNRWGFAIAAGSSDVGHVSSIYRRRN